MPSFEKVWPRTRDTGGPGLTFSPKRSVQTKQEFFFIGSRRGLATNDTLFCRHPAGDKDRGLKIAKQKTNNRKNMTQGKALAGGPGAAGWMQQREAVPEFPPLHDSADSDSDRENEKRPRV